MTNKQIGKIILKGKTQRHWIFLGFFIGGGIILLGWYLAKVYLILNQYYFIYLTDYFLISGFLFFWIGMKGMVFYIKVYENGVKVRQHGLFNYIKTQFVPYDQINEISLRGKRYPDLILQLDTKEIIVFTTLMKNYKEIIKVISNRIHQGKGLTI